MKKLTLFILLCWPLLFAGSICNVVVGQGASAAPSCAGGTDGVLGNNADPLADQDEGNATNPTLWWGDFVPVEDGSISYGHYYTHYNEQYGSRMVLMDTSGNVLDHSAEQAANADGSRTIHHVEMEHGYCLVSGTHYLVGIWIAADNYAGVGLSGDYDSGSFLSKTGSGMAWSDTSFDLSTPTGGNPHRKIYGRFNNSATTP